MLMLSILVRLLIFRRSALLWRSIDVGCVQEFSTRGNFGLRKEEEFEKHSD